MKDNIGFVLTFTAMLVTIIVLHGCTQLGKGDTDQRNVDVTMRATADECFMEVKGKSDKAVTDDTIEFKHPAGG